MIIICGFKKRTGKDLFVQILSDILPDKKIIRLAFADALKDEIDDVVLKRFDLPKSILDDDDTKPVMRQLLQWWGTEFRRSENPKLKGNPNYWINKVHEKIDDLSEKEPNAIFVITDGRFPDEHIITKNKYSNTISLHIKRDLSNSSDSHCSETIMESNLHLFDYTIENNGSLEEYKQKIIQFAKCHIE